MRSSQFIDDYRAVHIVSMSIVKKQVKRLQRQAAAVVNRSLILESDIDTLEIPKCLKRSLHKNYLMDKFWCEEVLAPLEEEDFNVWFEEPYLTLTNDEWLTIQNWNHGWPKFAYEWNHVKFVYYTINGSNNPLCHNCCLAAYRNRGDTAMTISKIKRCDGAHADDLVDLLQCMDSWCDKCVTTSLFWIEEWPWSSPHKYVTPTVIDTTNL